MLEFCAELAGLNHIDALKFAPVGTTGLIVIEFIPLGEKTGTILLYKSKEYIPYGDLAAYIALCPLKIRWSKTRAVVIAAINRAGQIWILRSESPGPSSKSCVPLFMF